jgi:hypothetical protein
MRSQDRNLPSAYDNTLAYTPLHELTWRLLSRVVYQCLRILALSILSPPSLPESLISPFISHTTNPTMKFATVLSVAASAIGAVNACTNDVCFTPAFSLRSHSQPKPRLIDHVCVAALRTLRPLHPEERQRPIHQVLQPAAVHRRLQSSHGQMRDLVHRGQARGRLRQVGGQLC